MVKVKWFDRNFDFSFTDNIFPSIIEGLTATPLKLEEKVNLLPNIILELVIDNAWSIKENIGHLIDLETLWQGRLEDIIHGEIELRPADLQNQQTHDANHNAKPLSELLEAFKQIRLKTISLIRVLDDETIFKSALHPRLKTPMRTMDLFFFVAEHDDHHLARIDELIRINYNT